MGKKELKGVHCLIPTVFDERGELNIQSFKENVRFLEKAGMHGIVAMASMGQYMELSFEEFKAVASAAKEECKNMACTIGTHYQNTKEAVLRTQYAEKIGADGVFMLPPYYSNWLDGESCYTHYKAVHDATSEIQIMFYNYEEAGFVLDIDLWDRFLADFPRITSVKECTPTIEMSELMRRHGNRLHVLAGAEFCLYPNMLMGGAGTVGVWATAFPEFILKLYDLCADGNWNEAKEYHELLCEYFAEHAQGGYNFDNKGISTAAGLKGGYQRPPRNNPTQRDIEFHKMWLKKLNEKVVQ